MDEPLLKKDMIKAHIREGILWFIVLILLLHSSNQSIFNNFVNKDIAELKAKIYNLNGVK